jgi:hypothetical protein
MLTNAQKIVLKADIENDAALLALWNAGSPDAVADAYNVVGSLYCWKSRLSKGQLLSGVVWTEFIARSDGEQRAFSIMLEEGFVAPSDPNIRQGFADIFSGAGGATTRNNLLTLSRRLMTRAENLFASGGDGSEGSPRTLGFEGSIFWQDVVEAMS